MQLSRSVTLSVFDGGEEASPICAQVADVIPRKLLIAAALVGILVIGILLRAWPSAGFGGLGVDEHEYTVFVRQIEHAGVLNYSAVLQNYIARQTNQQEATVPATRVGFLLPATILAEGLRLPPWNALRLLSLLASVGILLLTALMTWRNGSAPTMLAVTALMALAPLQIALAQRGLADEYFAFLALLTAWFFWEAYRRPQQWGWCVGYGLSLFLLILTKENSAFVFGSLMAAGAVLWLRRERPSAPLMAVSVLVPILAVLLLAMLTGGLMQWIAFYRMFTAKSAATTYAVRVQDGAWYRYLVDFTILSPCIVALFFGRIFRSEGLTRIEFFWVLFLGFSFVLMTSVRFGMSLRFAGFWDEPLRWLAATQLILIANRFFPRRAPFCLTVLVIALAAVDLSQYWRLFVVGQIYDPVTFQLIHASGFIR